MFCRNQSNGKQYAKRTGKSVRPAETLVCASALPFDDGFDRFAKSGIRLIVQPGGTDSDSEFIKFCNEHGIAMVFTDDEAAYRTESTSSARTVEALNPSHE
nr:hypothetical protein [Treponema socranskii]